MPQESNVSEIRRTGADRAVIFLHGFSGNRDDTWDRFPNLLGTATPDWDIFTIGYATTLLPDVVGIWSADPDLPILATMLRTQLSTPPFSGYQSLTLIAHSMGGLVAQKALVDDDGAIAKRVRQLILFGTPSGGLAKAGWVHFWKRQLKNMAAGSEFITALRSDWQRRYRNPPFGLLVVAGASDQFVPPQSSLDPFDKAVQRVVGGDHVSIVKPDNKDAASLLLVVATLAAGGLPPRDAMAEVGLAAQRPAAAPRIVETVAAADATSVKEIVDAALALDRGGHREESIALLHRHKEKNTDIKGTLGGRWKRIWFETERQEDGERALTFYTEALETAQKANLPDQIYYLAINVAFMKLTLLGDRAGARSMATLALEHAAPAGNDVWKTATVAEAYLYLDRIPEALAEYRRLVTLEAERWKHQTASLQATRIAAKLGRRDLVEDLESIFTPQARRVNRIFVSYSHKNRDWLDRLNVMLAPYLRTADGELELWDDHRLAPGDRWDNEIREALACAGVAVAIVTADFLASRYIMDNELPVMIKAAREGGLRLLWVYASAAGWEETPLREFQATHDTNIPLDGRPAPEQNQILKSIAGQIKQAALAATDRFKDLPA